MNKFLPLNSSEKNGIAFNAIREIKIADKNTFFKSCMHWGNPCDQSLISSHSVSKEAKGVMTRTPLS